MALFEAGFGDFGSGGSGVSEVSMACFFLVNNTAVRLLTPEAAGDLAGLFWAAADEFLMGVFSRCSFLLGGSSASFSVCFRFRPLLPGTFLAPKIEIELLHKN